MTSSSPTDANVSKVESLAHTRVADCYQCGKCSAGCPMGEVMDLLPHQLIRLVQMGHVDRAASAESPWICVSCMTCSTRCPQEVECAGVLDALKQMAVERDLESPAQQRTIVFQKTFLDNIRRNGRLAELELVGLFKTAAFLKDMSVPLLLSDAMLGPQMILKNKLHIIPKRAVKDRAVVKRIFDKCREMDAQES